MLAIPAGQHRLGGGTDQSKRTALKIQGKKITGVGKKKQEPVIWIISDIRPLFKLVRSEVMRADLHNSLLRTLATACYLNENIAVAWGEGQGGGRGGG